MAFVTTLYENWPDARLEESQFFSARFDLTSTFMLAKPHFNTGEVGRAATTFQKDHSIARFNVPGPEPIPPASFAALVSLRYRLTIDDDIVVSELLSSQT